MLLKNFALLVGGYFCTNNSNTPNYINQSGAQTDKPSVSTILSSSTVSYADSDEMTGGSGGTGTPTWKFAFGTGNTPPTIDDYNLSGEFISTINITNSNVLYGSDGMTYSGVATNTGEENVTINEIMLVIGTTNGMYPVTRDVLNTPITLAPNEKRLITIYIDKTSFVQEVA